MSSEWTIERALDILAETIRTEVDAEKQRIAREALTHLQSVFIPYEDNNVRLTVVVPQYASAELQLGACMEQLVSKYVNGSWVLPDMPLSFDCKAEAARSVAWLHSKFGPATLTVPAKA